ncbi:hypothetical protein [Zoogloea sp.]|uniref:hypothetical protein n=1 Tax=Zoogloea sp. TaxID=49181 RepID=UPI0035AE0222
MSAPVTAMPASPLARYRPLLLVVALLILPFAIGGGLYAWGWRPAGAASHGELLTPSRPVPALADTAGKPVGKAAFENHWTIIVAGSGPCEAACRQWIAATRQVHVALYKQMPRVQRAWVTDRPGADPAPLLAIQPDLHPLVATGADAAAAFDLGTAGHRVFVVDPLGQIILRYAPDADPKAVLKDMDRLLRYAWAG